MSMDLMDAVVTTLHFYHSRAATSPQKLQIAKDLILFVKQKMTEWVELFSFVIVYKHFEIKKKRQNKQNL